MAKTTEMNVSSVPTNAAMATQTSHVAVGMTLSKIQSLTSVIAEEHAPHFASGNPPDLDDRAHPATDGKRYYRPKLRVATRAAPSFGPEVRFLKDVQGKVRLVFELEEQPPPLAPGRARALPFRIDSMVLRWNSGTRTLPKPTVLDSQQPNGPDPAFSVRCGVELSPSDVEALNAALSDPRSAARIEVTLSFGYYIDTVTTVTTPRPQRTVLRGEVAPMVASAARLDLQPAGEVEVEPAAARANATMVKANKLSGALSALIAARDDGASVVSAESIRLQLKAERARQRTETRSDFRRASFTRSVPFTFDAALEQNRLVFAAIRAGEVVPETWSETAFGYVRKAPYPNTIYFMPQEVRLAFNAEMETAHLIPNLYRDEQHDIRVRLTLRAAPWFDPEKVVALRDHLYRSSNGAVANPQVVAGGYQQATLQLTTAFPEQIRTLNDTAVLIDLSGGVDVTLDVTLEFYQFLAELLTSPVGIIGEVRVVLQEEPGAEGRPPSKLERTVPVRLRLDSFASLPVSVGVEGDALRPDQITIGNPSSVPLRVGGCLPRLLQWDDNSVVPLEVFDAITTEDFPRIIAAGDSLQVAVKPRVDGELLWNAVDVSLTQLGLQRTATEVLERIHEVAPTGALSWRVNVECPTFQRSPLPPELTDLFRLEVQISRPGFATQKVVLGPDTPAQSVNMQRSLKELMSKRGEDGLAFSYRVRNVYFARQGGWSDEQLADGENLFVFPNPPDTDGA